MKLGHEIRKKLYPDRLWHRYLRQRIYRNVRKEQKRRARGPWRWEHGQWMGERPPGVPPNPPPPPRSQSQPPQPLVSRNLSNGYQEAPRGRGVRDNPSGECIQ